MVSITLSIPQETRKKMKEFSELNWSGFVRKCIEAKTKKLELKKELLEKLNQEESSGFTDWSVEMGRKLNEDIAKKLKKEGLT